MDRIVIIGTSCSGKTTLAHRLAGWLNSPHIHLDELYWGPDWTPHPIDEVRRRVDVATLGERWVCDGNYSSLRDLVWPRADAVIWLNYSLMTVMSRALRRTARRVWTREPLYSGNRETFRHSFLSRDSILWWALKTHERYRSEIPQLLAMPQHAHLKVFELYNSRMTDAYLRFVDSRRRRGEPINILPMRSFHSPHRRAGQSGQQQGAQARGMHPLVLPDHLLRF